MWVCCNWASVRDSPNRSGDDLQDHKAIGQLALPGQVDAAEGAPAQLGEQAKAEELAPDPGHRRHGPGQSLRRRRDRSGAARRRPRRAPGSPRSLPRTAGRPRHRARPGPGTIPDRPGPPPSSGGAEPGVHLLRATTAAERVPRDRRPPGAGTGTASPSRPRRNGAGTRPARAPRPPRSRRRYSSNVIAWRLSAVAEELGERAPVILQGPGLAAGPSRYSRSTRTSSRSTEPYREWPGSGRNSFRSNRFAARPRPTSNARTKSSSSTPCDLTAAGCTLVLLSKELPHLQADFLEGALDGPPRAPRLAGDLADLVTVDPEPHHLPGAGGPVAPGFPPRPARNGHPADRPPSGCEFQVPPRRLAARGPVRVALGRVMVRGPACGSCGGR